MGIRFTLERKTNTSKIIRDYLKERVKEKQVINEQIKRLNAQLNKETIDQLTYERLKDVLEMNYIKQREEALEKTFLNTKKLN